MRPIEGEENRFCVSMSECLNSVFLPEIIEVSFSRTYNFTYVYFDVIFL
uniref:Uncharacterized protein n=1 Tax=Heterorhabditis bacteriophora TaxID=37862 RepID=A0A1I7WP04_HETBA